MASAEDASWVRALDDLGSGDASLFGPKAVNLGVLARAGFPVPRGFAISGRAYAEHLDRAGVSPIAAGSEELLGEGLRRRNAAIERARLSPILSDALEDWLASFRLKDLPLAIRSSASVEDGHASSGAGLQESVLGVVGMAAVSVAVKTVWASFWSEAAFRYYGAKRHGDALVAVVVQRLVEADVSGALFTVNPVTGADGEILVNSAYGLGEAVLSGDLSPDSYVVDKATLEVRHRFLAEKREPPRRRAPPLSSPSGGRRLGDSSLSDEQLRSLAELGRQVEEHFASPRDVEWALAKDELYLLQARPVTALPERSQAAGDVWTNANVGEALPGVATPLTWSIASRYSERGFKRAFGALGCEVPEGAVLVSTFHGRIYLNLTQFLRIASQVPLLSARSLAELGGTVMPASSAVGLDEPGFRWSLGFFRRAPRAAFRLARDHLALQQSVDRVEEQVLEAARRLEGAPLGDATSRGLEAELRRVDALLDDAGDVMLTCAATSLGTFLVLQTLVKRWLPHLPGLEHGLLAGVADLESAKPGIALWHLAESLKADPEAAELIGAAEPGELSVARLRPEGAARKGLEAFFRAHGYRAVREAEIMAPRWSEEPTLILATLGEYLRSADAPPGQKIEQRLAARKRAWAEARAHLGPFQGSALRHSAEAARRYVRLRERLRARVTEVIGMYRVIALELGRRLGDREAPFFLTVKELYRYLRGDLLRWETIVEDRRRQFEADCALPEPPPTFVGFPPPASPTDAWPTPGRLVGLPASAGRASGPARVLTRPEDAGEVRRGDVLVVAAADVGWSPLFLLAAAIVTERGGVLSHASVVAREYGVPSVVGALGATTLIQSGQVVTVDGNAGVVVLHD